MWESVNASMRLVWLDIRKGSNLELYVAVTAAIMAAALNLTGKAKWLVDPVTIGLMAVIAIGLLKSRHQQEKVEALLRDMRVGHSLSTRFFWEKHEVGSVIAQIDAADGDVWLWGATLSRHVSDLEDCLVDAACRGVAVKVLLIPADGDAMRMSATRAVNTPIEELRAELHTNLMKLRRARRHVAEADTRLAGGGIEVRTLDYLAPYTLYAYSPQAQSGVMELRLGGIKARHDSRAGFTLVAATDQFWFDRFREQFVTAWDMGTSAP